MAFPGEEYIGMGGAYRADSVDRDYDPSTGGHTKGPWKAMAEHMIFISTSAPTNPPF